MRNILQLMIVLFTLFLASCGSKTVSEDTHTEEVIEEMKSITLNSHLGKWEIMKVILNFKGYPESEKKAMEEQFKCGSFTFSEDGIFEHLIKNTKAKGRWELMDSIFTKNN